MKIRRIDMVKVLFYFIIDLIIEPFKSPLSASKDPLYESEKVIMFENEFIVKFIN